MPVAVYVSFSILGTLLVIGLCGVMGVIKKGPGEQPYKIILPIGFVLSVFFAVVGFWQLAK